MEDKHYLQRCLQLAANGLAKVSPNPMVGAVIVHQNKIIGEGYHQAYGKAHAEVNAIASVKDKALLKESTLYVSLEPCAHYGKTPPCANLIVDNNIPHVVIACEDSFSLVAGRGIQVLKDNGIKVELGELRLEARWLNKRFFTFHEKKRPYIILKWAQSRDGFIDKQRAGNEKGINWISNDYTQQVSHRLRSEEAAILVGYHTVLNDNPSLTTRAVHGKNPKRIIWDKALSLNKTHLVFADENYHHFDGDLPELMNWCYKAQITSLIVEGGAKTIQSFIDANLWDEAWQIEGQLNFGDGLKAPHINNNGPIESGKLLPWQVPVVKCYQERLLAGDSICRYYNL